MSAVRRHLNLAARSHGRNASQASTNTGPRSRRRIRGLAGLATLILAATAAGACGEGTPSVEATSGCTAPGLTDDTLRLGVISPETGVSGATYLPFRSGVDARLEVQNALGGLNGRTVVSDWRDDESNPDTNVAAARQLVREGAFAVIEGSTTSGGSADYLRDQGVPVTGPATDQAWADHENMVAYSNVFTASSVTTWGDFVRDRQGTRAAVLSLQSLPSSVQLAERTATSLDARGVAVPIIEKIPAMDPDLPALADRMLKQNVDTLVASIDSTLLPKVVSAATDAGVQLKVVLLPAGYDQSLLGGPGLTLAGSYFFVDFRPFEQRLPSQQQFLAAMSKYAPQTQPAAQPTAVTGWIAADMMIRGLVAAGPCPTRAATLAGMRTLHDYDAGGLLLSPVNLAETATRTQTCFAVVQITADGGAFVPAEEQPRCGEVLAPAS
jgi:branched-chain amino acid transport system substrate-binding protein